MGLLSNPGLFLLHLVFIIPAFLVGFTLHEFAHALVAVRLGDPTPKNQGRLSLDPRRHLDPMGSLMVLLAGIGFARPVMINPRNLKGEWSQLAVSLAGPATNLLIAIVASILVKVVASATSLVPGFPNYSFICALNTTPLEVVKVGLYYMYTLNLYLMVFNLFPVPPLDGFELVRTTLRQRNPRLLYTIESNRDSIVLVFFVVALAASGVIFFIINLVARPIALLLGVPLGFPLRVSAEPRRHLPSVDQLTRLVRARLAELRENPPRELDLEAEVDAIATAAVELGEGRLRRVINATGVVLQTNLGRSPLSAEAARSVTELTTGYVDLEYDLEGGRRGERATRLGSAFEALLGHPAMVVNNNAASLLLCLFTLARGREVLVSRGELVEIGGSFRLPDVMRLGGARLVEVGTTNRTRLADYAEAITPRTAILLKVHPSNFRVVGFTAATGIAELATLARERGVVLLEDLGSGALLDTSGGGLDAEPTVQASLGAGADLVCFSGDKLLGGPQAGVIAGRAELVGRLRRSPLYRALRPDKLTLAALQATLAAYLRGTAEADLPLWRMLRMTAAETRARAEGWSEALALPGTEVVAVDSPVGGGSLPGQTLAGFGLALPVARGAAALARRLRLGQPPVVARVEAGRVLLDPRTVAPADDTDLVAALRVALSG